MVRRILSTSASLYVPSHNFLWLIISKHNTSSIPQKRLRDAVHTIITASARSSTSSHLWNNDTRFSFKFGRVKPSDILLLFDVCAPWFDSHVYPAPSDFHHELWLKTNSASFASVSASSKTKDGPSSIPSTTVSPHHHNSSLASVPQDSWITWISSSIIRGGS
ncbi:hypothetical protein RhiirA4_487058 [Rhizophagus irregularis]|uniref:Uncharacterized protein n=1 Tax=Rhizophagus irregularis TaxID=588596 RepID=A0A2I1HS48_9GLOM|nr:hypothetical protein RhiirA4_487058 [Rhizophagus irregularis]